MCRCLVLAGLLFLGAFVLSVQAADKKEGEPKEKLIKLRPVLGRISKVDAAEKRVTLSDGRQSLELTAHENIKVRIPNPPPAFDEKGNPKKYTKKELDELKGPDKADKKLRGYAGDFNDLRPGQVVEVHLAKKKDPPGSKTGGKKKKDEDLLPENKPVITMIVIIRDK